MSQFRLALSRPRTTTDASLYYALEATGSVHAIGLPGDVTVQANNFNIEINGSVNDSNHVVNLGASFPADATTMTPAGLIVPTGGPPIVLDYEDRLLEVDTDALLTVRGQSLQGHFDFTDNAGELSFSASKVGLTLEAGGTTILDLANGLGNFQVGDAGLDGEVSLDLVHGPQFSQSVTLNPAHFAWINTTAAASPAWTA